MIAILVLLYISTVNGITVDIVNITKCKSSEDELGTLDTDIESAETVDQLMNAVFNLPVELTKDAFVEYESNSWKDNTWKLLFKGKRSLCNSIIDTAAYDKFRKQVAPDFPKKCKIPAGDYAIEKFPISGQYVVLSDIRNAPPIIKHKVKLVEGDELILCRIVITQTEKN